MAMKDLSKRQKMLLMMVVRDYIDTAQPVGSRRLVERYHLGISSATVRNELAALTEMGYLRQPHTSAGRVPTEEGYRYFVSELMNQAELPPSVQHTIRHQFFQARQEIGQWMHLAASILAHQSQAVSLVTAPHPQKARFKHLELISTQGRQVLMVLVLVGGEVSQQLLTLAEPVTQEQLSQTATRMNRIYEGMSVDEIAAAPAPQDALTGDVLPLVLQDMRNADERVAGEIYIDGISNVLADPEFTDSENARRALRLFEEESLLQDLLSRTILDSHVGALQVLIGGDEMWEELPQCSLVLARYGVPGETTGTLGVLGPMRMPYAKAIPTVRFMSDLLSNLIVSHFVV
jgi:heat-inducible transcriptional repressor